MADDLEKAHEDLRTALESLRMSAVIRAGAGVAGASGLSGLALPEGFGSVLLSVVSGALIGTALVNDKVSAFYTAKRRLRWAEA